MDVVEIFSTNSKYLKENADGIHATLNLCSCEMFRSFKSYESYGCSSAFVLCNVFQPGNNQTHDLATMGRSIRK